MSILYVVLPLAIGIVGAAVAAYVWAARVGQFDDLTTPAMRVALDDEPPSEPSSAPEEARN